MYCTMAHLSLGISANDLQVPGRHEEAILLLWGCLGEKGGEEHAQMKVQRLRPSTMNKAVKKCHGMGVWRECYGKESKHEDYGGGSGRDKKRKKERFRCKSEFSKCITETRALSFLRLNNSPLLWNKYPAVHFLLMLHKMHLQHSCIFGAPHFIDIKKDMKSTFSSG